MSANRACRRVFPHEFQHHPVISELEAAPFGKSARRGQEMNDAAIEKMYREVSGLYSLDQIEVRTAAEEEPAAETAEGAPEAGAEKENVPELPGVSRALLIIIPAVWILIAAWSLWEKKKNSRKN